MSIGDLLEKFESSNVSRDNISRGIGRTPTVAHDAFTVGSCQFLVTPLSALGTSSSRKGGVLTVTSIIRLVM